jgi:hypothetical protein
MLLRPQPLGGSSVDPRQSGRLLALELGARPHLPLRVGRRGGGMRRRNGRHPVATHIQPHLQPTLALILWEEAGCDNTPSPPPPLPHYGRKAGVLVDAPPPPPPTPPPPMRGKWHMWQMATIGSGEQIHNARYPVDNGLPPWPDL